MPNEVTSKLDINIYLQQIKNESKMPVTFKWMCLVFSQPRLCPRPRRFTGHSRSLYMIPNKCLLNRLSTESVESLFSQNFPKALFIGGVPKKLLRCFLSLAFRSGPSRNEWKNHMQ